MNIFLDIMHTKTKKGVNLNPVIYFQEEDKENMNGSTNIDEVVLIMDDETDKKKREPPPERERENIIQREVQRQDSDRSSQPPGKDVNRRSSFNKRNQKPDIPQNRDQSLPDKASEINADASRSAQNYDDNSTNLTKVNSGSSSSLSSNRYPSGTPSLNLADLKKYRSESRSRENSVTAVDSHIKDMFLNSLHQDRNKYSTSPSQNREQVSKNNGHNNNPPYYNNENVKKFKSPNNVPVVGGEEKDGCCSIL